jgi:hypothetical protein
VKVLRRKHVSRYDSSSVKNIIGWFDGSNLTNAYEYEYDFEAERAMVGICRSGDMLHVEDFIIPHRNPYMIL